MIFRRNSGKPKEVRAQDIAQSAVSENNPKWAAPFLTAWHMIRSTGITKRWLFNTFLVVFIVLFGISGVLTVLLRNYYFSSIEQGLRERSSVTISYFRSTLASGINSGNSTEYFNAAQAFVESFENRDKMELQFINASGDIIVSSSGFSSINDRAIEDYYTAMQSSNGYGAWSGSNGNGEHVIAVTRLISRAAGSSGGAVRYVVSLSSVDQVVFSFGLMMVGLTILIAFLMLISGSYFINSIVVPVKQITDSADKIAKGNFDIRLSSAYDDEIGALVSAINSMAVELDSSEKVKNDFISTVSHELRTPLTAIKGWGETVRDCGADNPEITQKGMGIILRESDRLCGLVEELLDFSRLQSGRMKIDFSPLDLSGELSDTVSLFAEHCAQEDKQLVFEPPAETFCISGDSDRLRQVFVNIIDNSIKYTENGGHIIVTLTRSEGNAVVQISDNGCGIPADDLRRVGRRFYKANMTKRGFGIGLSVAEEIITVHNGKLSIDSVEGSGTTVTVTLPLFFSQPNT